jgi:3'-5' exoribonuclease-like protein
MKYFYDTEFIDDGHTIDLISIGILAEDGREYYAVSSEFPEHKLLANRWLVENVWPHLPHDGPRLDTSHPDVRPRHRIAREVYDFFLPATDPDTLPHVELWGFYADFDHVCLTRLWGRMIDVPEGLPMLTYDLKQEADRLGVQLPHQASGKHHALADARHNRTRAKALQLVP